MEKKKNNLLVALCAAFVVLVVVGTALSIQFIRASFTKDEQDTAITTFKNWSEAGVFASVPAMLVEDSYIGKTIDAGVGNYVLDVSNTAKADYLAYLALLEQAGFEKYVDNGEEGIEDSVFCATYLKEDLAVTVTFMEPIRKTYISVCEGLPLSEHLFFDESYTAGDIPGAQTTLHMMEMQTNGNSLVIQMKNGHFLISDGGLKDELPYLLDYLDTLTPDGEKPVIEGWFFTHMHPDHCGALQAFAEHPEYGQRIIVEGIYFHIPGEDALTIDPSARPLVTTVQSATLTMRTSSGAFPQIYRPQTGQKYYFDDTVIEITMAQEQVTPQTYTSDLNASSTVCMHYIDGQKLCIVGDADRSVMRNMMRVYSQEYFTVDMMTSFHHGIDTWRPFVEYSTVKTTLYEATTKENAVANHEVNEFLLASAQETYSYGDGTKVFTFPYTVGTAKTLPVIERIYNQPEDDGTG